MQRLPAVLGSQGARKRKGEGGSPATGERGLMVGTAAIITARGGQGVETDGARTRGETKKNVGDVWKREGKEKKMTENDEEREKGVCWQGRCAGWGGRGKENYGN